jgi:hypothetical protein
MKKEGNRPHFRSAAKRAAFEYLEKQLNLAQRKLRDNKFEIYSLSKAQSQLKADIAGIHQVIQEFKK